MARSHGPDRLAAGPAVLIASVACALALGTGTSLFAATARAQQPGNLPDARDDDDSASLPVAAAGDRKASVSWQLRPNPRAAAGLVRLRIQPHDTIGFQGALDAVVSWDGATHVPLRAQIVVPAGSAPGVLVVGHVTIGWPGAGLERRELRVRVREPVVVASATDLELEVVVADLPYVQPGGTLALSYYLANYADVRDRVRFSVDAAGWQLVDPSPAEEQAIESGEDREGVLLVQAPAGARTGDLHRVRILAVSPTQGAAESFVVARIAKPGTRTDVVQLPVRVFVGAAELSPDDANAFEVASTVDMTASLTRRTRITASYLRGPRQDLPASYRRLGLHTEPRLRVGVNNPGWTLSGGEIYAQGGTLAGTGARGDGASLRRTAGRLIGGFTIARPKDLGAGVPRGGHIGQVSFGVRFGGASVSLLGSDIARPGRPLPALVGDTTAVPDDQAVADLQQLALLFPPQNRVQAWGLQTALARDGHRLTSNVGRMRLSNEAGDATEGVAASLAYGFHRNRVSANLSTRRMPPSLAGVYIPGDSHTADASLEIRRNLRLTGSGYANSSWLFGRDAPTRSEGVSVGTRYGDASAYLHVQGNLRESRFTSRRWTSRSGSATLGVRRRGLLLSAGGEFGITEDGLREQRLQSVRGSASWTSPSTSLTLTGSSYRFGSQPANVRLSLAGSTAAGNWRFAGGGGLGRGGLFGSEASGWVSADVPLFRDLWMVLGSEYVTWSAEGSRYLAFRGVDPDQSPWRFTVGIRHTLSVPLPFLPNPTLPGRGRVVSGLPSAEP